jgi:type IV pilus assembly protein PilW
MRTNIFKKNGGFSLIELLLALVLSSMAMAALYRGAISQQKTYSVQEDVIDMQQNVRNAIDRMTREIRMAGYVVNTLTGFGGSVNSFSEIVTQGSTSVTIIKGVEVAKLSQNAATGANQLQLNVSGVFDAGTKRYLCLNGKNNYLVQSVNGNQVTLTTSLTEAHSLDEPVYLVQAMTFRISPNTTDLVMDENTGQGGQVIAENIEGLQFGYTVSGGEVRMVSVTVIGRTKTRDPQYSGDGYRRQTMSSTVELRNMGL